MQKGIKLRVAEALQDDAYRGIARIDYEIMKELGIRRGDVITIKGNRETIAIADKSYPADVGEGIIRIDGIIRKNARTGVGENVIINKADVREAKKVTIAPAQRGIRIQGDLKPGLLGRAVVKGDIIVLGGVHRRRELMNDDFGMNDIFNDLFGGFSNLGGIQQIRFVVVNTNPNTYCVITENTDVILSNKSIEVSEDNIPEVTYEDIGGLTDEVKKIREMVELPLKHPEVFERLGVEPPKGVLLYGPPGTGKTLLAKAVANESDANFILLNGPEVMCVSGDTPILTNPEGFVKAKEIFEKKGKNEKFRNYNLKKLDNPISTYSFKDGKIQKAYITHVTKLKAKSFNVKLSDGNDIKVSENQPFLVYKNGSLVWEPIKNLNEGDFVARLNDLNLPEENYYIPTNKLKEKFNIIEKDGKYTINSKNLSRSNFIKLPEKTSPELLELLGLIVSNGNISNKNDSIGFYNKNVNLIERFKFLMEKVFGIKDFKEKNQGDILGIIIYSKLLVEYLKLLELTNKNKENIPPYFFRFTKPEIRSFVRGYSDDGTVSQLKIKNINYPTSVLYSIKKEFLTQLQSLLLLKLGIQCKIKEHKTQKGLMYKLVIRGNKGRAKFLDNVKKKVKLLNREDIGWEKIEKIDNLDEMELFDFTVDKDSFVASPYILLHNSKFYGESEKKIRDIFEEAEKNAPSIIFIDEIDSIAPQREDVGGEVERRVVSQLLTMMDGLQSRGKVVVIAATNRQNSIDPALRRPGRFDRELELRVPDKNGRLQILKIHTRGMPLTKDVDLDYLASVTHGFVGADLSALAKEAAMVVLRRLLPKLDLKENEEIPEEILKELKVKKSDFDEALKVVRPSAMREVMVETPNIGWDDIGGLEKIKQELKEAVEWPLKYPEAFSRLGIKAPKGILLYGPPGTGKTLLAKAVAKESEANFIQVKGPSLLCVAKDTNIISSLCGLQNIEVFYNTMKEDSEIKEEGDIEYLLPRKEIFVQALKDKKISLSKVKRAYKLNVKDSYKITFMDGNKIEVSANQPFLSFNKNLDWVKTRDLKEGNLIAYPSKLKPFYKQVEIKIPDNKNLKVINEDNTAYNVKIFSSNSETRLPKFINEDLSEFLGWFVSEGGISKEKFSVKIYNINKENKERIKKLFELFVSKVRIKEFDKGIAVYSAPLIYYLEELFGQKLGLKKSYSINVPKRIFFENPSNISCFLRGAWKGDGHIDNLKAEYGTKSQRLASGISYLLTFLGIRHKLWNRKDEMFMITISGKEDLIKFNNIIFNKIDNSEIRQHYNAHLILPKVAEILRKIKDRNKLKYSKIKNREAYIPEGLFESVISRKNIGIYRLKRIMSVLEEKLSDSEKNSEEFRALKFLIESDLLWMKIKKIEISNEQIMYDVETEEGSFVGGSRPLLLHNSMWVGKSEEGMRKIFSRARQVSPCIIFFDEIDALASKRGYDSGTKVTERVLNQLLAEMDGIEDLNNVIVIGATNRPDMLDSALLRPGRFDRILLVGVPDKEGRQQIFNVHTKNMPLDKDVEVKKIIEQTEGYVGADIESFVREAAMLSLRENINSTIVKMKHFDEALKKVGISVTKADMDRYRKIETDYLRSAKAALETPHSAYLG